MGDPIYLAAFQGKAVSSDIRANLTQVEKQCVVAASRNAHLVAFPGLLSFGCGIALTTLCGSDSQNYF
jgi:predicted amidohydrolase